MDSHDAYLGSRKGLGLLHSGSISQSIDAPIAALNTQIFICDYGPARHAMLSK